MDVHIEKLFAPLVGEPTETEAIDADGMDEVFYFGGLEEDDDIIVNVEEDKAMQEMIRNTTLRH